MLHSQSLLEIARLFLYLGATAFGGPAAHIALMKTEVVARREWLTEKEFLDLLGAVNLVPGPNSTELAMAIGYRRAGIAGLVTAGVLFILPSMLMVMALAGGYIRFGNLPVIAGVLYGAKPVAIAVIAQAVAGLLKTAFRTRTLIVLGGVAFAFALYGITPLAVLFGTGGVSLIISLLSQKREERTPFPKPLIFFLIVLLVIPPLLSFLLTRGQSGTYGLMALFLFFLRIGGTLYGSGYALLAFLNTDLVMRLHWLTPAQLLDATAIGQATPGPVFTTATFIGFLKGGISGAIVATVGIFLPGFVFVAFGERLASTLRKEPMTAFFLDGVNVASVALMASVCLLLAHDALRDLPTLLLGITSAVLLIRFRVNSAYLLVSGAILGACLSMFRG